VNKSPVTVSAKFKRAVARATFEQGEGKIRINNMPFEIYGTEFSRQRISEVLGLAGDSINGVNVRIRVEGGGISGQTNAIRTSIASGLVRWTEDVELRKRFLEYDRSMVKGDVRVKESKKPGRRRARAKPQKSYR